MKYIILSVVAFLFANVATAIELEATQVSGVDNLMGSKVTDCFYLVKSDDSDKSVVLVGVNSKSGPSNNVILRIPRDSLPLGNGFSITDPRGYMISYVNGVLTAKRVKSGEGSANETILLEIVVSPDLGHIQRAQVQRLEGRFVRTTLAQMTCVF